MSVNKNALLLMLCFRKLIHARRSKEWVAGNVGTTCLKTWFDCTELWIACYQQARTIQDKYTAKAFMPAVCVGVGGWQTWIQFWSSNLHMQFCNNSCPQEGPPTTILNMGRDAITLTSFQCLPRYSRMWYILYIFHHYQQWALEFLCTINGTNLVPSKQTRVNKQQTNNAYGAQLSDP